ncbi:MAG: DUF692 domain-containing protein [Gammaproteobacteria bacterium]|nr:DUF692 domain-containing protein [Gammaproteobacteria bacterium]
MTTSQRYPTLGFGLGLRTDHYQQVLDTLPSVDWFEIISENYLVPGGKPLHFLDRIRADYPMVMHGVSMSIGGSEPLNLDYLKQLKQLAQRIDAGWISDHLCWTGFGRHNAHDLLPLPYSEEALNYVSQRIQQVQDILGRRILIENVSSYVEFNDSQMSEWDFVVQVAERSDCLLLVDVNNIYVSARNHQFDAREYIDAIPTHRVQQIHLAGHTDCGTHIIDTHDEPVCDDVWQLYAYAIKRFGEVSTMIERDDNIPPLETLLDELDEARRLAEETLAESTAKELSA